MASPPLQSYGNIKAAPSLSSPLLDESNEPYTTIEGTLEAMHHAAIPVAHFEVSLVPFEDSEAALEPVKRGKGVGKRLTDRQRVEILDLIEKAGGRLSNAEIGRRYGITRAAIQKLKQKGPEVRARYRYGSAETRDDRKRGGHVLSVPFERELFEWVRGLKARKVPVPPSLVKEKAKLLVPKYRLKSFQASNGWYYNFCKRFNLSTDIMVEEKVRGPAAAEDAKTTLDPDEAELQQITINAHIQHLNYQQIAALAAVTLHQQQEQVQQEVSTQSKGDRMLALLEHQNALLERQNSMIDEQTKTIESLYAVVTVRDPGL